MSQFTLPTRQSLVKSQHASGLGWDGWDWDGHLTARPSPGEFDMRQRLTVWLTCIVPRRSQPSGARNQAAALQAEGVTVTTGALGELMVDFAEFGWFPRVLPSEEAQGVLPSDEEEDEEGSGSDD